MGLYQEVQGQRMGTNICAKGERNHEDCCARISPLQIVLFDGCGMAGVGGGVKKLFSISRIQQQNS